TALSVLSGAALLLALAVAVDGGASPTTAASESRSAMASGTATPGPRSAGVRSSLAVGAVHVRREFFRLTVRFVQTQTWTLPRRAAEVDPSGCFQSIVSGEGTQRVTYETLRAVPMAFSHEPGYNDSVVYNGRTTPNHLYVGGTTIPYIRVRHERQGWLKTEVVSLRSGCGPTPEPSLSGTGSPTAEC